MTFTPANSQSAFLPVTTVWSEDESQRLITMTSRDTDIANYLNVREIALYPKVEILSGQQWFDPNNVQRSRFGYRKIFSFGVIAPGATLTVAHGITGIVEFTLIYATCKTDVVDFRPIPFVDPGLITTGIGIRVDATNYYIVNGATAPQITSGTVVLEYLKN